MERSPSQYRHLVNHRKDMTQIHIPPSILIGIVVFVIILVLVQIGINAVEKERDRILGRKEDDHEDK
jgi:hypothetical protein